MISASPSEIKKCDIFKISKATLLAFFILSDKINDGDGLRALALIILFVLWL